MIKITLFFWCFVASAFALELSPGELQTIQALLKNRPSVLNHAEEKYQKLVQKQTFKDLLEIYAPENQDKIQITYASFTPEKTEGGGDDLGFGLHIVKRLELREANGKTRVIDVNEAWGEDKKTSGLFLPDELRMKVQVFEGERYVPGSQNLYLFDSIHIAWGSQPDEGMIFRKTKYTNRGGTNSIKAMRVPVSAPFSCVGCHKPTSSLAKRFLEPGETRNYEAIVQNSHFKKRPEEMRGYQQYVEYLKSSGKPKEFIERVEAKLKDIRKAAEVPHFYAVLKKGIKESNWSDQDDETVGPDYMVKDRQGVYLFNGKYLRDPMEDTFEGKYRWWEPVIQIP